MNSTQGQSRWRRRPHLSTPMIALSSKHHPAPTSGMARSVKSSSVPTFISSINGSFPAHRDAVVMNVSWQTRLLQLSPPDESL